MEPEARQDVGIQCELLRDSTSGPEHDFDILNTKLRRKLVRRVYLLLIVCYISSFIFLDMLKVLCS